MATQNWKLNPSDFAFLWEECKRCFYLKVVERFNRPRHPMPRIFNVIDSEMRSFCAGKRTSEVAAGLPKGVFEYEEKRVRSAPITVRGHSGTCYLSGKLDTLVRCDDKSFGVVDFKTTERKTEQIPLYSRQLHAYAYALEHPAPGNLALGPISRLGLLVFEPAEFEKDSSKQALLSGALSWVEIKRNEKVFLAFISEVLTVLEMPNPPSGSPDCEWCRYRLASRTKRV